ncbi:MAG: hypothetical protein L3J07_01440 [Candidatus Magasanikbacteria bacterium]|nr:hypothetical protein [Candidatus Magasanikbacteria bacterium]
MEFQKLYKLSVFIFVAITIIIATIYLNVGCDDFRDTKISIEYENMIEVGDIFFVRASASLSLPENPIFLKGTKQEHRNLNKRYSLILGRWCKLKKGGYFKVLDLNKDEDENTTITFIYILNDLRYPSNNFCPSGLKGYLYLDEFISKIEQ